VRRARHYLGANIAHLGGLDVIVFTGEPVKTKRPFANELPRTWTS